MRCTRLCGIFWEGDSKSVYCNIVVENGVYSGTTPRRGIDPVVYSGKEE